MNDFTPEELRHLLARLDPMTVLPEQAAEELARVRLDDPALADAAQKALADASRLYDELVVLPPSEQDARLARLGADDPAVAALLGPQLRTGPYLALPCEAALPPEAFWPAVPPHYTIVRELGQGGMAIVYQAQDSALRRVVALKFILDFALAGPEVRLLFQSEAQSVARLEHPNIIRLFEFGELEGRQYFSLEYCTGGSLAHYLSREKQIPARPAARLIRTLALAVQHAHGRGLIHRDLKPANVLLQRADAGTAGDLRNGADAFIVKVADFGLACRLDVDRSTLDSPHAGTALYMAPEQIDGRRGLGPGADIYALGGILCECMTGRPPFLGTSAAVVRDLVCHREPTPPRAIVPDIPADLEAICLKCLAKDPEDRYASAAALADDLERFLDNLPTFARPLALPERTAKFVRRQPVISALSLAAVSAVFFGGFSYLRAEWAESDKVKVIATERISLAEKLAAAEKRGRHDDRVKAARALAERGDWRAALPMYEEAIRDDLPDRASLEARRLRGWLLMKDSSSIQAEFDRLLARLPQFAPEDAALVRLSYGDYLHSDMSRLDEAARFVREARDSGKLGPADAAYADGLLSPRTADAIVHFEKTLSLERVHPRAHHALMLTRLVRGELAEARDRARLIEILFPDDAVLHLVRAFADMLEGDYASSMRNLDPLAKQCSPERVEAIRSFMAQLHALHRKLGVNEMNDVQLLACVPAVMRLVERMKQNGDGPLPFAFNVPVSKWMKAQLEDMVEAAKAFTLLVVGGEWFVDMAVKTLLPVCGPNAEPAMHQLLGSAYIKQALLHSQAKKSLEDKVAAAKALALLPLGGPAFVGMAVNLLEPICGPETEPVVHRLLGRAHFDRGIRRATEKHAGGVVAALEKAGPVFRRGVVAPTLAPRASTRYRTLFGALQVDALLLYGHTKGEFVLPAARVAETNRRIQGLLPELLVQGRKYPDTRLEIFTNQGLLQHLPLAVSFTLLEDLQRDLPDDLRPLEMRIRLGLAHKNWGLATSLLDELADKAPKHKDLPAWKREVGKKILEGFKD